MSRWICVNDVNIEIGGGYIDIDSESFMNAPSIDIVFCDECKYNSICNHGVQHITHDAYSVTIGIKTVEWCSYGVRKTEEESVKECVSGFMELLLMLHQTEPQTEYEKYLDKIRPHDPHKNWYEDKPQTEREGE